MNLILEYILGFLIILFFLYVYFVRSYILAKKKFKCLRCGNCCRLRVRPSKQEIEKIKKKGYSNFITKFRYLKRKKGYCQFLKFKDGKTECSLEDIKPKICRTFPAKKGIFGKKIDTRCATCYGKLW